ncbi:hypothetical protein C1H46_030529 [Malus baccata]|uniref:DEAD/DEAH-box helicase domain-containing protein n=1 Tax=Malus baccata TaxID=106549 RepID=A0A540LBS8_MALBA|nr:hypothetical protein C1H46_030529 [Malus baccata]
MAPSRELVQQIHSVIFKFAKALSLRFVPVYGGSGIAQQTGELKLGAAFVVCTPGVLGGVTLPGTAAVVPGMGLALVGH